MSICIHMHTITHLHYRMYMNVSTCTRIVKCICAYTSTYIHAYTHSHTHMLMHTYPYRYEYKDFIVSPDYQTAM